MWWFKKKKEKKVLGKCETCLYFEKRCKRYPKSELTDKTYWCGEYVKKN